MCELTWIIDKVCRHLREKKRKYCRYVRCSYDVEIRRMIVFINPTFAFVVLFVAASRQIRRRVPYAGHLMTPRRLWLNKIPTLCDVVIEFPGNCYLFSFLTTPAIQPRLFARVLNNDNVLRDGIYVVFLFWF